MVTLDGSTTDGPDKADDKTDGDSDISVQPKKLVLVNGKPICSHSSEWRTYTTTNSICRYCEKP